jgi:unsaturated chondroitin disaccharide hydrolase
MTRDEGNAMERWIGPAIEHAVARVRHVASQVSDFPHITEGGRWRTTHDGVWTGGFWAGLLWLASQHATGAMLRESAVSYTERLLPRAFDEHNHDLGFMFYPSAIRGWELTGDARYKAAAIDAARSLARQFNPRTGFIPGWGFFGREEWSGSVLVDTLMNLPLLAWASQQQAGGQFIDIAHRHAATTLAHHCRPDGSVYHVFRFDPADGKPLGGDTYQGLSAESVWSRGQAWAITGLAIMASMTGQQRYLEASTRVARFFLGHLPADVVPPWDLAVRDAAAPRDSSAAAIASFGLLKLHRLTGETVYRDDAGRLLQALFEQCAARSSGGGLLLHATADLPHGLGIDESTMYGDYYYLKSLLRLQSLAA